MTPFAGSNARRLKKYIGDLIGCCTKLGIFFKTGY
jgi:hypothetical protein